MGSHHYQLTKEVQIYGVVEFVQSAVRDLRHLFQSAIDRQRAPESADRPAPSHRRSRYSIYVRCAQSCDVDDAI